MSNEKMSADEALKVLRSLVTPKANQSGGRPPIPAPGAEEKRAKAIEFFAAMIAEHNEDQGVIAVWRGRCERAEAERDALIAERDDLRAARIAYASEFGPDADGMPNVGSIHENIRKLKAERDVLKNALRDVVGVYKEPDNGRFLRWEIEFSEQLPFVAYSYSQRLQGAEDVGRSMEEALRRAEGNAG